MFTGKCAIRTASLVLLTLSASPTFSEPARTIKIVVPQTPGGSVDFLARVLAEYMGQAQRVTMVVENRPGAGSEIGTEAASRAIPDGNTLLINGGANLLIVPHLRKVGFDPLASFVPICNLANGPNLILVNSASPYRTLAELLDAARARPGELTLATIGPATESQIQFEKLQHAAGVKMTFGTDAGVCPHGINARQFAFMVKYGMTPMQAIQAATVNAADLIGHSELFGSIKAGKSADIIAAAGDPLTDIKTLETVTFVMKEGVVYKWKGQPTR